MVAENVHIDSIKITRKYNEFAYFYSCPRAKLSPGFLSPPSPPAARPRQKKITNFIQTAFSENLFFPSTKEGGFFAEKITKN